MAPVEGNTTKLTEGQAAPSAFAGAVMDWLRTLLGLALLFVVGINVMNALGRYLIGVSPVGADELMVYMIVWVVMVAAIMSLILRSHINVNLLPLYLKGRAHHLLHIIHDVAAIVACGYATYSAWLFIARISKLGLTSMGLGIPMSIPHAALLVGFAGLTLTGAVMFVRDCLALIRNDPLPEATP